MTPNSSPPPVASLKVLPTARTVPFTATAISFGGPAPPETRPVTQVGIGGAARVHVA